MYPLKSATFTPGSAITGFATISPGINLSTDISGVKYNGSATDSDALGGQAAASYLRSDANDTTSGTFGVLNANELNNITPANKLSNIFVSSFTNFYI